MNPIDEPVVVYSGSYSLAGLIKGLLEAQGIRAFLQNEFLGSLAPWYLAAGGVDAVQVVVAEGDAENAREIVEAFTSGDADGDMPST
jgi:sensor domain CHASE-containing protein